MWPFISSRQVECPYCFNKVKITERALSCVVCKQIIPLEYYDAYPTAPPFFIPVIGWSQTGKSVFLETLTLTVEKMGRIWPDFIAVPLGAATQEFIRERKKRIRQGNIADATNVELYWEDAHILYLQNMEPWGSRTLVMRDMNGELFHDHTIPKEFVPLIRWASTAFFMISIPDLEAVPDWHLGELFSCYARSIRESAGPRALEGRRIVVILSKADRIVDLPDEFQEYLARDPMQRALQTKERVPMFDYGASRAYLEKLKAVGSNLQAWFEDEFEGERLTRAAKNAGIPLQFTIISSTGADASNGVIQGPLRPTRILDPFFLALEAETKRMRRRGGLE